MKGIVLAGGSGTPSVPHHQGSKQAASPHL